MNLLKKAFVGLELIALLSCSPRVEEVETFEEAKNEGYLLTMTNAVIRNRFYDIPPGEMYSSDEKMAATNISKSSVVILTCFDHAYLAHAVPAEYKKLATEFSLDPLEKTLISTDEVVDLLVLAAKGHGISPTSCLALVEAGDMDSFVLIFEKLFKNKINIRKINNPLEEKDVYMKDVYYNVKTDELMIIRYELEKI